MEIHVQEEVHVQESFVRVSYTNKMTPAKSSQAMAPVRAVFTLYLGILEGGSCWEHPGGVLGSPVVHGATGSQRDP